jgi:hypothetical protein
MLTSPYPVLVSRGHWLYPYDIYGCRRFSLASAKRSYIYVTFEVFTAMIMQNDVFWDINIQFVPLRRHFMSPLQSSAG